MAIYLSSLEQWLHECPYQLTIAFVSFIVGAACLWDGPALWRALFTTSAAAVAAGVMHVEVGAWGWTSNSISEAVIIIQIAVVIALAVHSGFEGFQLLFGLCFGVAIAHATSGWVRRAEDSVQGVALVWYEIIAIAGVLVYTVFRKVLLAMVAPLAGGLLAASGMGVLCSSLFMALADVGTEEQPHLRWLPPLESTWISAAAALLGPEGAVMLAVQCVLAIAGALVHLLVGRRRWPALMLLVSGIAVTSAIRSTGVGCQVVLVVEDSCPEWLEPETEWRWPVLGCFSWALLAALSAWRQLGLLPSWDARGLWMLRKDSTVDASAIGNQDFSHDSDERAELLPATAPTGGAPPAEQRFRGNLQTRLPQEFTTRMPNDFPSADVSFTDGRTLDQGGGHLGWLLRRVGGLHGGR